MKPIFKRKIVASAVSLLFLLWSEPFRPQAGRPFDLSKFLAPSSRNVTKGTPQPYEIAILGLGNIGRRVIEGLNKKLQLYAKRLRRPVKIVRYVDISPKAIETVKEILKKDYGEEVVDEIFTNDPQALLALEDLDVVIEVTTAQDEQTYELIEKLIRNGTAVITSNKAFVAKYGRYLIPLAEELNVPFLFEASVGGGIPFLNNIHRNRGDFVANPIQRIAAVINGTTNYILLAMEENKSFLDALKEAVELKATETRHGMDTKGYDARNKAVILARQAFGVNVDVDEVYVEGILGREAPEGMIVSDNELLVTTRDIEIVSHYGYRIKLVAVVEELENGKFDIRVHPTLIPKGHPLYYVEGPKLKDRLNNRIVVTTVNGNSYDYGGPGAGPSATVEAIEKDLFLALRKMANLDKAEVGKRAASYIPPKIQPVRPKPMEDTYRAFYLYVETVDRSVEQIISEIAPELGMPSGANIYESFWIVSKIREGEMEQVVEALRQHPNVKLVRRIRIYESPESEAEVVEKQVPEQVGTGIRYGEISEGFYYYEELLNVQSEPRISTNL